MNATGGEEWIQVLYLSSNEASPAEMRGHDDPAHHMI